MLASLPPEFLAISGNVWIAPAPAIYALVVSLTLWVVFEYLPLGRYLYVLGASPRAAELNGISAKRYITLAFIAAGIDDGQIRRRARIALEQTHVAKLGDQVSRQLTFAHARHAGRRKRVGYESCRAGGWRNRLRQRPWDGGARLGRNQDLGCTFLKDSR